MGSSRSGWRRGRRARLGALVVLLVTAFGLTACTQEPQQTPGPEPALAEFVDAWQHLRPDDAAQATSDPPEAAQVLDEVMTNLRPDSIAIQTGPVTRTGATATTQATVSWVLPDAGTWTYPVDWTWRQDGDGWTLDWSPAVIHPKLGERQTLAARSSEADPGSLVDRNNTQIVSPIRVYSVVLLTGKTPDLAGTAAALATILTAVDPAITADAIVAGVQGAIAEAAAGGTAGPTDTTGAASSSGAPPTSGAAVDGGNGVGYTVINVRESDFQPLRARLEAIPGLVFPSEVRNLPPSRDFARALLAQVNPVVAPMLEGTPGWKVITVDTTGGALETLSETQPVAGQRVVLTLDSTVQQAAEAAIAGIEQPAVFLAMQPSTGEILAVAQNGPADAQGTPALTGQYPPGSTFKIVTATAALDRDLMALGRPVDCPGSAVFDGREVNNSHDFALGTVDSVLAFARSCNTTFAALSTQMPADALNTTAPDYGIGLDFVVQGITTLTGSAPVADTTVQRAENGFGQGTVLITPFSALLMAATAANGTMPMPLLIRDTTTTVDRPAPARSPAVQADIRTLMRAVVEEGTGVGLVNLGDVHAKTGTAEFTADDGTKHAHAWTIGYRGDLAFATLIVGGEDSVYTIEAARAFLASLPG